MRGACLGDGSVAPSLGGLEVDVTRVPFGSKASHEPTVITRDLWVRWKPLDETMNKHEMIGMNIQRQTDPDLGMFFAEQAIQLYIKAVYYELFGERVRGHRLKMLEAQGFKDLANEVLVIVDQNRRLFILAEDAYSMARYGDIGYSREEVGEVVKLG